MVVNLCILINVRGQLHGRKSCSFPHSHRCCFVCMLFNTKDSSYIMCCIVTNSLSSGLKISVGHGHFATHSSLRRHSDLRLSETEVYCLSVPSELVSDRTVTLSNVNQNVPYPYEARMLNGESE